MKKLTALILSACFLFLFAGCDENKRPYKDAVELMENGMYSEAADAFAALGDYEDAAKQTNICKYKYAEILLQDKKVKDAIDAFGALGDYSDSKDKIRQIKETYYFENFDYAVPMLNVVIDNASCKRSTATLDDGTESDVYSYSISYSDAEGADDKFGDWIDAINSEENVSANQTTAIFSQGMYNLYINDEKVGMIYGNGYGGTLSVTISFDK